MHVPILVGVIVSQLRSRLSLKIFCVFLFPVNMLQEQWCYRELVKDMALFSEVLNVSTNSECIKKRSLL